MEHSYFLLSNPGLQIDKLHLCIWEFRNRTCLMEFGCEIESKSLPIGNSFSVDFFIPWLNDNLAPYDLCDSLKETHNSKFIFNESVAGTDSLDDGSNDKGVIQHFQGREDLAILPISFNVKNQILTVSIDLTFYNKKLSRTDKKPNIYIRFYLEPNINEISTRKNGINRSTIIYDTQINVLRNLPKNLYGKHLCDINKTFCFHIIPNEYDIFYYDSDSLQTIRTLEYDLFKKYLPDRRVKDKELIVIFNKQQAIREKISFNFFIIFRKERIGLGQFALAFFMNLICGILLALPVYRDNKPDGSLHYKFPLEFWVAIIIEILTVIYFIAPYIKKFIYRFFAS